MQGDASPFEIRAGSRPGQASPGVLCIHGFTGAPFEMRYLGERLGARGFHALGPLLPGHGLSPEALDQTSWPEWLGAVDAALDRLLARCDRVAVAGESLGGLLALRLAQTRPGDVAAVASLATPLWLPPLAAAAIRATRPGSVLGRLVRKLPKLGGSDIRDPVMRARNPAYEVIPVRALHQVVELMSVVRRELEKVRAPTLVIHARQDHTVPYACSEELVRRVSAPVRAHRALERSYHVVAIDVERDIVATEVAEFFAARLSAAGPPTDKEESP